MALLRFAPHAHRWGLDGPRASYVAWRPFPWPRVAPRSEPGPIPCPAAFGSRASDSGKSRSCFRNARAAGTIRLHRSRAPVASRLPRFSPRVGSVVATHTPTHTLKADFQEPSWTIPECHTAFLMTRHGLHVKLRTSADGAARSV